jgi:hypothetical protein
MNNITDSELENSFYWWLDHYMKNGDKHYYDTPEWKITELYWDNIVDRVLQDLPEMNDKENEKIIERLSKMF